MDAKNGGVDGKPVIIVMPKYLKTAADTYDDFQTLTAHFPPVTAKTTGSVSYLFTQSSSRDDYAAKMAAFLDQVHLSDSDSNTRDSPIDTSPPQASRQAGKEGNRHLTSPSLPLNTFGTVAAVMQR
jgi:hypothetical protein